MVLFVCTISESLHDHRSLELVNADDDWLSDKVLAHLFRSIVYSTIRQLDGTGDDWASDNVRASSELELKRGRSYIGRRASADNPTAERRAAERERVYIGKRTRALHD